ncbi:MAG: hypothetical protein HQ485_04850 [Acidobacteria bacterium]|nr:hypothetical protein [Acidobacteriota bacterium]
MVVLSGYAAFGVLGTYDYFSWGRAHWRTLDRIAATGRYAPAEVDGGLAYVRSATRQIQFPAAPRIVVTLGDLDEYRRCQLYPYDRWMPRGTGQIFVLVAAGEDCPVLK